MSSSDSSSRRARLEPLFQAARSLADSTSECGQRARQRLVRSSGLSVAGVELALQRCLETQPSEREIEALIRSTPTAQVAHVLLSANVFVAAHRAIAIGLAASAAVRVRASRREPEMAELLWEGAPNSFQLVPELTPHAGDRVWAYGSDATLDEVAVTLPQGVALHAHGSGFGVAVLEGPISDGALSERLSRLAEDIALFDQRGCLSPRVLLVGPGSAPTRDVAAALAAALSDVEARVPRGKLALEEAAAIAQYRDMASYAGEVFSAALGFVSVGGGEQWLLPPVGRNIHVLPTSDVLRSLAPVRPMITSCAFAGEVSAGSRVRASLPGARFCQFGEMQSPPFDGPVDRREI